MKINGTTVRGGWSQKFVYGNIGTRGFQLSAKDSFVISNSQLRYIKQKIESGKMMLPDSVLGTDMYVVNDDKTLTNIK